MVRASFRRKRKFKLPPKIIGHKKVKIGWPVGEVADDVIERAIYNHFGTSTIPERPALSNAMRDNRAKYQRSMRTAASSVMKGEAPVGEVVSKLGIMAQGDVQAEINNLKEPPNAPSTVARKKSSNPLVDTGEMKDLVTYQTYD